MDCDRSIYAALHRNFQPIGKYVSQIKFFQELQEKQYDTQCWLSLHLQMATYGICGIGNSAEADVSLLFISN